MPQEPARTTRTSARPVDPTGSDPTAGYGPYPSSHHSRTLPWTSESPHGFGRNKPTSVVCARQAPFGDPGQPEVGDEHVTEGGDCNTVTHILGVRAFGTPLLCEQVIGRGLRRASYTLNRSGHFDPEYAEVYGVPFQFIPCAGDGGERDESDPPPKPGRIKAVPERLALRPYLGLTFPRLTGYRYEMPPDRLTATCSDESRLTLSTAELPTKTENAPIVGESVTMTLDEL